MAQEKIQLPRPTGSYIVGMSTHFLKDISRHHNEEKSRPLLVHIYYPSVEIQKEYPPYLSDTMHLYKEKLIHAYDVSPEDLEYLDGSRTGPCLMLRSMQRILPFPFYFSPLGFLWRHNYIHL